MKLPQEIIEQIEAAENKAFATYGGGEVNVVPVSVVRIVGDVLWLHDFFMDKTVKNINTEPKAAISFWSGIKGVQLKGTIEYQASGAEFEEAEAWVAEKFPERTLRGLLVFTPTTAYDISVGETAGKKIL